MDVKELSKVSVDVNEPSQVTIDHHKSSHVYADLPESLLVSAGQPKSHHVTADRHESSQVTADRHESSQVTADRHESSQVTADRHESSQVTADRHESSHFSADLPESLHVRDSVRTSFGLLLVYLDYLSALPYWILFADRRPTLALGLLSALSVSYLFADVFDPACFVTMSINKSLQMDPHASRLVGSVTTLQHHMHCNREI